MAKTQTTRTRAERIWEIVPAALTWGCFIGITLLSFIAPTLIASLILTYVVYWVAKSILMSAHLIQGFRNYRKASKVDWFKKLTTDHNTTERWEDIWHVIVVANAKEELPIVRATLQALKYAHYRLDRLIIVLANEARFSDIAAINRAGLEEEFGQTFGGLFFTLHPADIAGEVRGKGANITYAAETIIPELKKRYGFTPENVLVTTLDADNRVHPHYFAALTWTYLTTPDRELRSYQPLPMFFNNIWSVPYTIRSIAVGSSFWHMIEATRGYRLRNFSAHTQSLALLLKTKYWSNQTIVEDGHQYWRSLFATDGKHTVVPIYIPIFQDAVLSPDGHLMTYREQYLQKRRWAWGASDVSYVFTNLWKHRRTYPLAAWSQAFRLIEGHFSWAATSLILAVFGWFPVLLNSHFQTTALSYNFVLIYQRLLTFAMVGMVISLVISRILLPPRPKRTFSSNDWLEWALTPILLPITNLIFGSLPAIDAQTRLALGKYLEFRITEKSVTREELPVQSRSKQPNA